MGVDPRWTRVTIGFLALAVLAGCTRSLEVNYSPALYRLPQADTLKGIALGVAKPEDRRATVVGSDPDNLTYVMRQGSWRFGLTYKAREFVPVADLVQTLFVEEFTRAGIESKPIAKILAKDKVAEMKAAGEQAGVAYVLGGRVLVFEITNDVGWTVISRRSVTLEATLVRVQSGDVAFDNVVSMGDRDDRSRSMLRRAVVVLAVLRAAGCGHAMSVPMPDVKGPIAINILDKRSIFMMRSTGR
jgi:hypothetical protein